MQRNPDAGSHLAYVRFLAEKQALPGPGDCSVCHHPPLYYAAAALVSLAFGSGRALQLLSLVALGGFGLLAARCFARLFARPAQQALATALVVLWPLGVIASARVNNDVAFYLVAAACFYFLLRWWQTPETRWLGLAAGAAALGLFVKANALVLVLLVLAVVLLRTARRGGSGRSQWLLAGALVMVAALHGFFRAGAGGALSHRVLGTAYKTAPGELDPRGAGYYTRFEPRSFVRVPYAEAAIPRGLEPTFWNHWLKSSLHGTRTRVFAFLAAPEPPAARRVAQTLNALLLALLAFGIAGAWLSRRFAGPYRELLAVSAGVWVAAAVAFHALVPTGHHADFRFVFPVLIPAGALYVDITYGLRRRGLWLWHAGYLLVELFVAFSLAYVLALRVS